MLIPAATIYFWAAFTSLSSIGLIAWIGRSIEPGRLKTAFLACLCFYLFYSIPLLAVHLLSLESPLIRPTSQLIHGGGIVFVALLGRFVIMLAKPEELSSWRYRAFMANYALLFVASFCGLVEHGVAQGPSGFYPVPGPLMTHFNCTMVCFAFYFLTVCGIAYRRSEDDLLLCQLRAIFWTGLPAFSMLMITNAIIPGLTGNFEATPAGALWLLLCFAGVGHILMTGKDLLIDQELTRLAKATRLAPSANLHPVRSLVAALARNVSASSPPSTAQFRIVREEGEEFYAICSKEGGHGCGVSDSEIRGWIDAVQEIAGSATLNGVLAVANLRRRRIAALEGRALPGRDE